MFNLTINYISTSELKLSLCLCPVMYILVKIEEVTVELLIMGTLESHFFLLLINIILKELTLKWTVVII
jgi:hypothetical protein